MRNKLIVAIAGVTVLSVLAACSSPKAASGPPGNPNVEVTATCTSANQIDVKLNNWVAQSNPGGVTLWSLNRGPASPTNADVTIEPKGGPEPWPFATPGSFRPTQGAGTQRNIRSDATRQKTYKYNIRVVCGQQTVLIDPDIFVN